MGNSVKTIVRRKSTKSKTALVEHACLFLDCQTTGASPAAGGSLLEVGWTVGDGSGFSDISFDSFLIAQPDDQPIPGRIQMLTGITDEEMVSAIPPDLLYQHLMASIKPLPKPLLCVMHYARFETPFLNCLVEEFGGRRKKWPLTNICTFEIARRLYPNLPSRGIRALGGYLGIDMDELKRTRANVEATRVIWRHLVAKLDEIGVSRLDQLEQFLSEKAASRSGKLQYPMQAFKRLELPNVPGVYRMLSQNGRVLYVGKATSLKSRVNSHFRGRKKKTNKSMELLTQVADIEVIECGSPLEAALLESDEIKRLDPPYNVSLKQRSRSLLFASPEFLSFSESQDEVHTLGPLTNPRAIDALLRLAATINSGIPDAMVLFENITIEDLIEGIDLFLERHGLDFEEGTTPRQLIALGLTLFRSTKRTMRQLALEATQESEDDSDEDEESDTSSERVATETNTELTESDDDLEDIFLEDEDLTPEEIANRLDSLLMGIARSYLVSKEMTSLLNSRIRFHYRRQPRQLTLRQGRVYLASEEFPTFGAMRWQDRVGVAEASISYAAEVDAGVEGSAGESLTQPVSASADKRLDLAVGPSSLCWVGLDIKDFDRIRVLLTETAKMISAGADVVIEPRVRFLSRW